MNGEWKESLGERDWLSVALLQELVEVVLELLDHVLPHFLYVLAAEREGMAVLECFFGDVHHFL